MGSFLCIDTKVLWKQRFGSKFWGEYFLRKKCELMSVLAVLELHLAQSIQLLHLYSFLCVLFLDKKSGFDFQDDVLTKLK